MWFGDLVTMAWFDDVWTKEVFANYYAAEITEPLYPDINHDLNTMRNFYTSSLNEDRTAGTTAIQQPLENLQDAGLIYGRIIYNKAPVMMLKLVEIIGKEKFREGIQVYLKKFAYGNATWDDLIAILDSLTDKDLIAFSNAWVKEKGMSTITTEIHGNTVTFVQSDKYKPGIVREQVIEVIAQDATRSDTVVVNLDRDTVSIDLGFAPTMVIPNSDGRGYGYFKLDDATIDYLAGNLAQITPEVTRQSVIMMLYENYVNDNVRDKSRFINQLLDALACERNELIATYMITKLTDICEFLDGELRASTEVRLQELAGSLPFKSSQLQVQRQMIQLMSVPEIVQYYYNGFIRRDMELWGENDYTTAAYELAVRMPDRAREILAEQRGRISNPDRLAAFDFISRACATADTTVLDGLFESLLKAENRRIEPYAKQLLYYLNHPTRDVHSSKYILPGLEALREVQLTGDIFFTRYWCEELLLHHRSSEARKALRKFLDDHPDYPQLLKNKILQASTHLL
jgi:aminopeptidase N